MNKKGVALILALGVLAVVAIIATSFAVNMRLEYRMAQNFQDNVLVREAALGGVYDAISRIKNDTVQNHFDTDNIATDPTNTWVASFGGTFSGANYTVTVKDCGGLVNINDVYNEKLGQIIQNLSYAINAGAPPIQAGEAGTLVAGRNTMFEGEPFTDNNKNGYYDAGDAWNSATQDTGFTINGVTYGAGNGVRDGYFASKEKLKLVKDGGGTPVLTDAEYNQVAPYITCYSYIDTKVIKPNAADLSAAQVWTPTAQPVQPRSPINLNTADPLVLRAIFRDINDGTNSITAPEALSLATRFKDKRDGTGSYAGAAVPFKCWDDVLSVLLDAETAGEIADGDAAIVMANLNPNTDIMTCNPNASWRDKHITKTYGSMNYVKGVGKNNLTNWSTEGSFSSSGYYDINSISTFTRGSNTVTKTITTVVKAFDIIRDTTQADFQSAGSSPNNVRSYPEPLGTGSVNNAVYDGQIMLKDNEVSTTDRKLVSHYNSTRDADLADGGVTVRQSYAAPERSVMKNAANGSLMPDGMFVSYNGNVPYRSNNRVGYAPINNVAMTNNECGVEMWIKSLWAMPTAAAKKLFTVALTTAAPAAPVNDQYAFMWAAVWGGNIFGSIILQRNIDYGAPWGSQNEGDGTLWGTPPGGLHLPEAKVEFPYSWNPGIWHHYVWKWQVGQSAKVYIDGILKGDSATMWLPAPSDQEVKRWVRAEITGIKDPAASGGKDLMFGNDGGDNNEVLDSTIDEIRTWEGPVSAENDYGLGRYYNYVDNGGVKANYISSSLAPSSGIRLGAVTWTAHLPVNLTDEYGNSIVGNNSLQMDYDAGAGYVGGFTDPKSDNSINQTASSLNYKTTFTTDEGVAGVNPSLRDTPVLDDVTITYIKDTKFLSYKEQ